MKHFPKQMSNEAPAEQKIGRKINKLLLIFIIN